MVGDLAGAGLETRCTVESPPDLRRASLQAGLKPRAG